MSHSSELQEQYEQTFKRNLALEKMVESLAKEARTALRTTGMWNQEFNGNEIVGVIAIYIATREQLAKKTAALTKAVEFIGSLDQNPSLSKLADNALEQINQLLVNESIDESISKLH